MNLRMVVGAFVVVSALATAAGADAVLERRRTRRIEAESRQLAEQAMMRARDAFEAEQEALRLVVHGAATTPSFVAAVRGRVDAATAADLFASESWWAPYRDLNVAFSYDDGALAFFGGSTAIAVAASSLLTSAAGVREPIVAALVDDEGEQVVLAAARAIETDGPMGKAVLELARPFDQAALDRLAKRVGGGVVLSDGARALGFAGPPEQRAAVALAVSQESRGVFHVLYPRVAAVASPLAPGLWLWAGADASGLAGEAALSDAIKLKLVWGGAALVALTAIAIASRARRPRRSPSDKGALAALVAFRKAEVASREAAAPPPALERNTPVPNAFGRYLLLDRIGEGGMAEIYLAISSGARNFRRTVVIKRLRAEMTTNPEAVSHFIDEANLAASLVHPNIVPVFDFGQAGSEYFIAEEYILGRDLRRLIIRVVEHNEPPLSTAAILFVVHELLGALEHAHGKCDEAGHPLGIVHRDVSPQNTLISLTGEVKLLDFGIVKTAQGRLTHTEIGMVKGNVDFMSPEQARGRDVDGRADLFSLGLLICFCALHGALYRGDTVYERLTRAALGPAPEDLERVQALREPLPQILTRALAVDPAARFASAAEFRAAVEPYIAGGRDDLAAAMARLFGEDLRIEQERLAAARPPVDPQAPGDAPPVMPETARASVHSAAGRN